MKQISIGVDEWIENVIKAIAEEREKTISEVVREILAEHLLVFKPKK